MKKKPSSVSQLLTALNFFKDKWFVSALSCVSPNTWVSKRHSHNTVSLSTQSRTPNEDRENGERSAEEHFTEIRAGPLPDLKSLVQRIYQWCDLSNFLRLYAVIPSSPSLHPFLCHLRSFPIFAYRLPPRWVTTNYYAIK